MSTTQPLGASGVEAKLAFVLASTLGVLAVAALLVALAKSAATSRSSP